MPLLVKYRLAIVLILDEFPKWLCLAQTFHLGPHLQDLDLETLCLIFFLLVITYTAFSSSSLNLVYLTSRPMLLLASSTTILAYLSSLVS